MKPWYGVRYSADTHSNRTVPPRRYRWQKQLLYELLPIRTIDNTLGDGLMLSSVGASSVYTKALRAWLSTRGKQCTGNGARLSNAACMSNGVCYGYIDACASTSVSAVAMRFLSAASLLFSGS